MKGTIAFSWGPFGGIYTTRHRVCLGWVAVTYVPHVEVEDLMRGYLGMAESALALWFTPDAIRDHFDGDEEDDPIRQAVMAATDDQLREVSEWCIGADTLYSEFHRLLVAGTESVFGIREEA